MQVGKWVWNKERKEVGQVIESQRLWGEDVYRVWMPGPDTVVRVRADLLEPISVAGGATGEFISYVAAATRVADALTQNILLAPIESSVIPLPHQVRALERAMADGRVRYLLADEVGLGKTIEAGLILRELKLRGLVRRTLVIAPKGLVTQWVSEMRTHFNEDFRLLIPGDFDTYRNIVGDENIWKAHDQVVCPMDSVKPLDERRGWSKEQVGEYNRERFDDLVAAGWDLVVVDEAHRLGGSTDQVARYKLGKGLAEAAPYLLLLSATPHQGKTDAFHRLVSMLDSTAFPDVTSVSRDRVQAYVIRTEKRRAIDAQGQPLFKPRQTRLAPVSWQLRHREQQLLYEAVTEYVREGYNQALRQKKSYVGFLMILMQRLVTSSTRAIRTTLERRLESLQTPEEQLSLFPSFTEEWAELDGQEQMESLLKLRLKALKNERQEVQLLLEAAWRTEAAGPDAKAEALLDTIYRLQQEETDPDLKVLIFTEFVPTQEMLREFLTDRGFSVVCLNGAMGLEERKRAQEEFARKSRVLVSTDAGGEGLNLQFCHVVINYDIPWNPMKLEQRIGRVDRIGQPHTVRALNFVLEETVEYRVRDVLEAKLAVIFDEFGVDKTGDVLDSAQAGELFDSLYVETILDPANVDAKVEAVATQVKEQAEAARSSASILGGADELDPGETQRLMAHPMPHWVERMTVSYLAAHGGKAEKDGRLWRLTWPTGERDEAAVFNARDAEEESGALHLTLEDSRIRGLAMRFGCVAPGQPIPCLTLPSLPVGVRGFWALWRIAIHAADWNQQRILPIFLHEDGRILQPTARHVWDQMMSFSTKPHHYLDGPGADEAFDHLLKAVEAQGKAIYEEIVYEHRRRLAQGHERAEHSFAARRRAIERIGLQAVRSRRLAQLEREEREWTERVAKSSETCPELTPIIVIRMEGRE